MASKKVSVVINGKEYVSPEAKEAGDSLTKLGKVAQKAGKVTEMAFKAAVASIIAVAAAAKKAVQEAADMETISVSFDVLIGNAEKAQKVIKDLRDFSASTPLQFADIAKGAQNLMAFGIAADDVLDKMEMLGNVSMGNTAKLESVVRAYGKIQAKGKASLEELNMITEAGIPILAELSKQYNVTGEEMFKIISAGTVGFADVDRALQSMTSSGGQFEGMLKRQSETANGLVSTLKDNIAITLAEIGDVLLPDIKNVLIEITGIVKSMQGSEEVRNTTRAIADIAMITGKVIYHALKLAGSSIKEIVILLKSVFTADFWEDMGTSMWTWFVDSGKAGLDVMWKLIKAVGSSFWEPLKNGFNIVMDGIKITYQTMMNFLISGINGMFRGMLKVYNWLADKLSFLKIPQVDEQLIKPITSESLNLTGAKLGDGFIKVSQAFSEVDDSLDNFISQYKEGSQNVQFALDDTFSTFTTNMGGFLDTFLDGIKVQVDKVDEIIPDAIPEPMQATPQRPQQWGYSIAPRENMAPSGIEKLISGFMGLIEPLASVQALLNPLTTIFSAMMEVLGPVINEVLYPLVGILKILGQTLGAILVPVVKILVPVIEAVAKAFTWLYNNAILPFANFLIEAFNMIRAGVANFLNGFIIFYNSLFGWMFGYMKQISVPGADDGKLRPIDIGDLSSGTSSFAGGGVGSSTSVQSLNITVAVNVQGNIIGAGGMEQVGEYIVSTLQAYAGAGGTVTIEGVA